MVRDRVGYDRVWAVTWGEWLERDFFEVGHFPELVVFDPFAAGLTLGLTGGNRSSDSTMATEQLAVHATGDEHGHAHRLGSDEAGDEYGGPGHGLSTVFAGCDSLKSRLLVVLTMLLAVAISPVVGNFFSFGMGI